MPADPHRVAAYHLLKAATTWNPADTTLANGEAALARIITALAADVDLLDGKQLTASTAWISSVADTTVEAEAADRAMRLNFDSEPQF